MNIFKSLQRWSIYLFCFLFLRKVNKISPPPLEQRQKNWVDIKVIQQKRIVLVAREIQSLYRSVYGFTTLTPDAFVTKLGVGKVVVYSRNLIRVARMAPLVNKSNWMIDWNLIGFKKRWICVNPLLIWNL